MPAVKSFTITYNVLNEEGTFSEGDVLSGTVTLELSKETKAKHLFVKAKGDANTRWTKKRGDRTYTFSGHRRYFKLKQFLIPEGADETVLPEGIHVYKFSFNIPRESMPTSFSGTHGKIVYKLEAKLARSWRMDSSAVKELNFVSKSYPNISSLLSPLAGSTDKEMGLFSKGHVHMDATINKAIFAPGETIEIVAKVNNSSSRDMTPKFSLTQDVTFHAQGDTKHESHDIQKVSDNPIKPQTQQEVRCVLKIPDHQKSSVQNCELIKVEYNLKVYLDISFAYDPEILFPLVIAPLDLALGQNGAIGPYPVGAFGPSNINFPPAAVPVGPYPAYSQSGNYVNPGVQSSAPPPPYPMNPQAYGGPPGVYPPQPPLMYGVYNNPAPQGPSPYGSPFSTPSSSSVLHPPPPPPAFHSPPSAPQIQPLPSSQPPSAPPSNLMPSSSVMNTDFLSQSDDGPPSYSLLFQSGAEAPEKSDPK